MNRTWVVAPVLVVASACGSSGTPAQNAAQTLCDKVCSCSSTCTVASVDSNGQEKEPLALGTAEGCRNFYGTLLASDSVDPSACASAAGNVQCMTDTSSGDHFVVPPQACRTSVVVDAGSE